MQKIHTLSIVMTPFRKLIIGVKLNSPLARSLCFLRQVGRVNIREESGNRHVSVYPGDRPVDGACGFTRREDESES